MATENNTQEKATVPPPLSSSFDKPVKTDAILEHKTRFNI